MKKNKRKKSAMDIANDKKNTELVQMYTKYNISNINNNNNNK